LRYSRHGLLGGDSRRRFGRRRDRCHGGPRLGCLSRNRNWLRCGFSRGRWGYGHRLRSGRGWLGLRWRRRQSGDQLAFQVFGSDFVEAAGGDPGFFNAQFLGDGKDDLAFDPKFLSDLVNANGHMCLWRSSRLASR